jgi:hypothetical protein
MEDLEFGGKYWTKKYKNVINYYKRYKKHKKQFLTAFIVITFGVVIRWGFSNVDRVVNAGSAISFEESVYKPFTLEPINQNPVKYSKRFVVKESMVNRRMQILNLEMVTEEIHKFLKDTGNICVHVKQFGVKFDILVFENITMINPEVISEGKEIKNIPQIALDGSKSWASRTTKLYVKHYNEKLEYIYSEIYNNQAFCFAFYEL